MPGFPARARQPSVAGRTSRRPEFPPQRTQRIAEGHPTGAGATAGVRESAGAPEPARCRRSRGGLRVGGRQDAGVLGVDCAPEAGKMPVVLGWIACRKERPAA